MASHRTTAATTTPITTAARATATATFSGTPRRARRLHGPLAAATLALVAAAACGGSSHAPFAWLVARAAPGGWPATTIPSGARLAYPPGWRAVHGDRGTASVALLGAGGRYLAYLNATPRQGPETLGGWTTFRLKHNAEEGDRHITRLAAQTQLRFLNGSGSCVKDSYATVIGAHYIEIACIVSTGSRSTVVVAAAPPTSWPRVSPLLERAISAFKA